VAGSCKYGDELAGFGAAELVYLRELHVREYNANKVICSIFIAFVSWIYKIIYLRVNCVNVVAVSHCKCLKLYQRNMYFERRI
jgi:hypothetical protein